MKNLSDLKARGGAQLGYTLVELMIALVIGLVIILGAGRLFLSGFQSFRQINELSTQQAVLIFAADSVIRDMRRGRIDFPISGESGVLRVTVAGEDDGGSCTYTYSLSNKPVEGHGYSLRLGDSCGGGAPQPLVPGFAENGFSVEKINDSPGFYKITFSLIKNLEENIVDDFAFHVVNRTEAVNPD